MSSSERDVDLTVELHDFDENGKETMFGYVLADKREEPVTRGWLRASHRALDPKRSRPHQPYHLHTHNDWLTPGAPVEVDVDIWPTAMVFKAGHRIGLTVHCGPYKRAGIAMGGRARVPMFRSFSPSSGTTNIHTGGERSSWLELPVIPADPAPCHALVVDDQEFSPASVTGQMGDRFVWTNSGQDYHSVTERSGLRLWDSQLVRGVRSHYPETWWLRIPWAGTFEYRDEVSGFEGTISIPVGTPQTCGADTSIEIDLGLERPPDGAGFDVELRLDGGEWSRIHEGTQVVSVAVPPLAAGRYSVRSRLRRLDATQEARAETGWSPVSTFEVG